MGQRGPNPTDHTGERYGRLVVLKGVGTQGLWQYRCDCGQEGQALGASLRSGRTKSCGCLRARKVGPAGLPICTACGQEKPTSEFYPDPSKPTGRHSQCKSCSRERERARLAADPQARARLAEQSRRWKQEHPQRHRANMARQQREKRARERVACFDHYGWACTCCGETESAFLVIDHIDGGGNEHRRQLGNWVHIHHWLVLQGFPDGFQTHCHNCNFAKSHGGCPHQSQR